MLSRLTPFAKTDGTGRADVSELIVRDESCAREEITHTVSFDAERKKERKAIRVGVKTTDDRLEKRKRPNSSRGNNAAAVTA